MKRSSMIAFKSKKPGEGDQPTELEIKGVGTFQIKSEERGEVEAIIATLGVVDRDYDVITETAIKSGSKVKMSSYGHDAIFGDMPVGKGTIEVEGNKAIFRGNIFLETQRGRETFGVLKGMGKDQEWSFGFRVMGSEVPAEDWKQKGARRILTKLDAFEVSPVIVGAGVGTRTLDVKEERLEKVEKVADPPAPTAEELEVQRLAAEHAATEQKTIADRAAAEAKARLEVEQAEILGTFERFQRTSRQSKLWVS